MWLPSRSAWLIPHSMPPISWLRASSGLSTRPGANAPSQPADADEAELRVDGDLGELRAEREQPVRRVERRRAPGADRLGVGHVVARQQLARRCRLAPGRSEDVRRPLRDRHRAGRGAVQRRLLDRRRPARSAARAARVPAAWTAELTMPAPAEPTAAVLLGRSVSPAWNSIVAERDAERVGADLGRHGEHAGAELLRRGLHDGAAVGVDAGPRPLLGHEERDRVRRGRHAGADQPVAVAGRARRRVRGRPTRTARRRGEGTPRARRWTTGCRTGRPACGCAAAARPGRCRAGRRARPSPSRG